MYGQRWLGGHFSLCVKMGKTRSRGDFVSFGRGVCALPSYLGGDGDFTDSGGKQR